MFVGYGAFDLHLPGVGDLKGKRRIVRSLAERMHARWRVSVAEVEHHELHQRARLAVAVVARDLAEVERILGALEEIVAERPEVMVLDWRPTIRSEEE